MSITFVVALACLMVNFLETTAATPESANVTTSVDDKGVFDDRSGVPFDGTRPKSKPAHFEQQVYLYRGPNRPLEPYFYRPHLSEGQWHERRDYGRSKKPNQKKKTRKVRRDEDVIVSSPIRDDHHGRSHRVAPTRHRPMQIRYDGEPFESIETLRQARPIEDRDYARQLDYETLPGGVFEEPEENRRQAVSRPAKTPSNDVVRTGRRAERPPTDARHTYPTTHPRPSSHNEGHYRDLDHYDGDFSKPQRSSGRHKYHGTAYDYETHQAENSGRYGYRTGAETRRDRSPSAKSSGQYYDQSRPQNNGFRPHPFNETKQPNRKHESEQQQPNRGIDNRYDGGVDRGQFQRNGNEDTGRSKNGKTGGGATRTPSRRREYSHPSDSYSFVAETGSAHSRRPSAPSRGRYRSPPMPIHGRGPQFVPGMELASQYDYE